MDFSWTEEFNTYVERSHQETQKKIDALIKHVREAESNGTLPKLTHTFTVALHPNFFALFLSKMKFYVKRRWREERRVAGMSKSEWMASKGFSVRYEGTK